MAKVYAVACQHDIAGENLFCISSIHRTIDASDVPCAKMYSKNFIGETSESLSHVEVLYLATSECLVWFH